MNSTNLRYGLLGLSGLSLALSISALGTAAHTLSVYHSERATNPWFLPLWSQHFDTQGTVSIIGASATVIVLSIAFLALSFLPKLELAKRQHLRAFVTLSASSPSALVTLAAVVLAHVINHQAPDLDTIQTWTCRYGENPPAAAGMSVPTGQSNQQFSALCTESKYALYTTLVVFLLQAFMMGLAVVSWFVEMWAKHRAKKEWQDASSMEMSRRGSD